MEKVYSLICTRCGSHHIEVVNDELFKCISCDALIRKEKAVNFEKEYKRLTLEGKNIDITNLRYLARKALEGHINKDLLINACNNILTYLPDDIISLFYIKYINRKIDPFAYESFLESLINKATITEVDEIIDVIISSTQKREEERIRKLANYFYGTKYDNDIDNALLKRQEEIELFSDIPRDIFICHSSLDIDKVNEILKELEKDGNTCWISSRNIPWDSDNYWLNIEKAIKSCNIFLCLNSINTMQSNDCIKEVEIASSLNKKRIEYKLDEARDITLFKNFFTGQWITNINDLLDKVYDLKHKEEKLLSKIKELISDNDLEEAKEVLLEYKNYSNDKKKIEYANTLIKAIKFINQSMYEEAKKLLILLDSNEDYIISLIEMCNSNISIFNEKHIETSETSIENKDKEESNTRDILKKAKFLLNQTKDYQEAEKILFEEIAYNENSFELWYYYLYAITKGLKENNHKNVPIAFENLKRLVPNERKKDIQDLDNRLNPITIKLIEEENKRKAEEKKLEEARRAEEKHRVIEESRRVEAIRKLKNCIKGDIVELGSYPQTIKVDDVAIINAIQDEKGYFTGSDGEKYALLKANPCCTKNEYSSDLFSNGEKIVENVEYYFKVEPIKWQVLEDKDGKAFLFSELILDVHKFDDNSNDYSISSIRKWLNNEFYNKAFTDKEKELISMETIDIEKIVKKLFGSKVISEPLSDKVFLLSKEEITNTSYGFKKNEKDFGKAKCKKVTDYAKANSAFEYNYNKNGCYWLRTSYPSDSFYILETYYVGYLGYGVCDVCKKYVGNNEGVAPALFFDKTKA